LELKGSRRLTGSTSTRQENSNTKDDGNYAKHPRQESATPDALNDDVSVPKDNHQTTDDNYPDGSQENNGFHARPPSGDERQGIPNSLRPIQV